MTATGISKNFILRVGRECERQGATVGWSKKGLRVKTRSGVVVIHKSPGRAEVYRLSLVREMRKIGIEAPGGVWK